jgi:hypothetical protein
MGYSDQKYYARPLVKVASAVAFGTSTGAGTASNSLAQPTGTYLPQYIRRTQITGVKVVAATAIAANANPVSLNLINGTNTFAAVAVGTATQGQTFSGVVTASNAVFAAGGQPTMNLIGTWTASGGTSGTWDIYFEQEELPV